MLQLPNRTLIIIYSMAWTSWAFLQTLAIHITTGIDWLTSLTDAAVSASVFAGAGYLIMNMVRFYHLKYSKIPIMLVWGTVLALASVYASKFMLSSIFETDAAYIAILDQSLIIRLLFAWLIIDLIGLICAIWFYLKEQDESGKRQTESEKLVKDAELSRLRQQLQPHFLFNSLNSVSALIGTKPEEARTMIQQLSDFLRGTVKKDDQQLVTLEEELAHLQLYLDIEKVRFGHRLNTEIETTSEARTTKLPSLLLQPIVENAIKFGLYDTLEPITIRIYAGSLGYELNISVSNPFDPETAQPRAGTGFGLSSVQRRLYLIYARNDLLTTTQDGKLFTTEIKIPQPV